MNGKIKIKKKFEFKQEPLTAEEPIFRRILQKQQDDRGEFHIFSSHYFSIDEYGIDYITLLI